ncbi:formylglycine-generating enzyme family protein [Desulfobacterales bacterium HSG16]|nr:formylglycine-generating enzyme family protein [Desulfobacterales bacterium HSG16]
MRFLISIIIMTGLCIPAMAGEGMMVFKTIPRDVDIYIDGEFKGKANEVLTLDISEGNHVLKIVKDGKSREKKYFVPSGGIVKVELSLDGTEKKGRLTFNFIRIKPGTFQMGSNDGYSDEKPVHTVTITKAFEISDHEVTVGEYRKFVESTGYDPPSKCGSKDSYKECSDCNWNKENVEDHPINCVSWEDAQSFISWLNMQAGKPMYRLPTEAEWEYAARAGTKTRWSCGDGEWCLTQMGWFDKNSGGKTHPVKTKMPNYWKLYDMHGNVREWVQDWYDSDYYSKSPGKDPLNSSGGSYRVLRGGSWNDGARYCRSPYRRYDSPGRRLANYGFRLVLLAGQQ